MSIELTEAFCLFLPCDARAPRAVREELDKLDAIDSVRGDAKLVATEIVSNAVLHSGCTPGQQIEVHARLSDDLLEIAVQDPGCSESDPRIRVGRAELNIGGLGLVLVERLSYCWGTRRRGGGGGRPGSRLVWARFQI